MTGLVMAEVANGLATAVNTVGTVAKGASNVTNALLEERVKSIAEKARRGIMMYKVLLSSGLRDAEIAEHITKYLEGMYSVFTLITLGYNPAASDNTGLHKIVDSVSAESFNENSFDAEIAKRVYSQEMMFYETEIASKGPRIGKNVKSTEAQHTQRYDSNGNTLGGQDTYDDFEDERNDREREKAERDYYADLRAQDRDSREREKHEWEREDREINNAGIKAKTDSTINRDRRDEQKLQIELAKFRAEQEKRVAEVRFMDNVAKNNDRRLPTIVNMKCYINNNEINVPIAVKCNAYPIGSEELRLLIESGISGKASSYLRKIKWRSGEISTLDYIFNTDIANRDKKLYEKLGRNPWYIELQKRKAASKTGFWARIFSRSTGTAVSDDVLKAANGVMELSGYRGDIPPTASLVVTSEDLVAATRLSLDHFQKNEGFIAKFMKDSFLLGFGIVDLTAQQLKVFFLGYTSPFILTFDELKKTVMDPNKALYEAVQNLSRKV